VRTCLIVIDMQHGFCSPEGSAARAGLAMWRMDDVVAEHVHLLEAARRAEVPVVFTRYGWRANGVDVDPAVEAAFGPGTFRWGTADTELVPELAVEPGDTVVDKPRFDCFLYTELDLVLRRLGVERLLLTGVTTNGCVGTTARTAVQLGYEVQVAEDATSAREDQHLPALASIRGPFGVVAPWRSAAAGW
jgi:ureidoacrylate peracid hydrolase